MSNLKEIVYHGVTLAPNSFVKNMRLEPIDDLDGIPDNVTTAGRMWFDESSNAIRYTVKDLDNPGQLLVRTIQSVEDLPITLAQAQGWKDSISAFSSTRTRGTTEPLWADIGNGIYAYHFADNKVQEVFILFHTNHDYKPGSKVYPHIHWLPKGNSQGNVVWKADYTFAKGHQQGEILTDALNTLTFSQTSKGVNGEHYTVEVPSTDAIIFDEADTIMLARVYRDTLDPLDTFNGSVVGLTMDLHYYSDRDHTPGKSPDFQTPAAP